MPTREGSAAALVAPAVVLRNSDSMWNLTVCWEIPTYRSELSSEVRDAESVMLTPEKDDLM